MDIIFNPPVNTENKYIQIMVDPLRQEGYHIHELDGLFSSWKHFRRVRLIHLNWFENIDDSSIFKGFKSFFRKIIVLTTIHLSGKKLVWTMHNRMTHEKKTGKMSGFLTNRLLAWSDAIIIHCELSRQLLLEKSPSIAHKIHHIPHPDFVDSYGPAKPTVPTSGQPLRLLFVGAVKPYKNIELLMETVGDIEGISLTIAGKPKDDTYKKSLVQLAGNRPNINLQLEFIPDRLLPELLGDADLVVLPYDLNSSLNSGTVMLAFSYHKTVVCPEIGTLVDMQEAKENFFGYRYRDLAEHRQMIKRAIGKARALKKQDETALEGMGKFMQAHVLRHQSKALVGNRLKQLYAKLLTS
ncbi:glycosyltransferase family 4 protein [Echinicola soli]|uniref:Glycosyltransferase family 4 protein n=1 Tax=Echinicola soli TaxID=2591634 RepID=A0A514CMX2_9BACT|nr:glycosyltransferase family 4 protein [Echinicola soli]QDH81107.1 glycosyltransferase family 4 protein [Echinicola soli]